jgi:2,4'-dihydroxyacetophenone dioxygenase
MVRGVERGPLVAGAAALGKGRSTTEFDSGKVEVDSPQEVPVPSIALDTYALDSHAIDWIPAGPGLSFKPLAFRPDNAGWVQLLRLDPGTTIPRHRHTGEVHAFNLAGHRLILGTDQVVGPQTYVHERPGDVDSWMAIGDVPCVVHVDVLGTVEYLGADDEPEVVVDAALQRELYVRWCAEHERPPHPSLVRAVGRR